jgi:hypothetical protein
MFRKTLLLVSLLLALPIWGQGSADRESVRRMVDGFYKWYVPLMQRERAEPASDVALREKAALFSPKLLKALKEDSEAARHSPDEIVGIDWDPFLDTQDPERKYVLGEIQATGDRFLVKVHGVRDGRKLKDPTVIAVVVKESGRWVFEDFLGPDGEGLLAALQALKKGREAPRPAPE